MKLLRKEVLQKSLFTTSVFALVIVASGGLDKGTSIAHSRSPANSLQSAQHVKYNSTSLVANSVTCDYSAQNHKVCANKTTME